MREVVATRVENPRMPALGMAKGVKPVFVTTRNEALNKSEQGHPPDATAILGRGLEELLGPSTSAFENRRYSKHSRPSYPGGESQITGTGVPALPSQECLVNSGRGFYHSIAHI